LNPKQNNKMSELLENFSIEDLMTPTVEQGSMTVSLSNLDLSLDRDLNMDLDMSDFPVDLSDVSTDGFDFSATPVDFSLTGSDFVFNSDSGSFKSLGFNSFGSANQFAQPHMMSQQFMPMYAPQYPYPSFGCPPGFMLVSAPPVFYGQQPMMPVMPMMQPSMQMPVQNPIFSFTPAPDAPVYPNFNFDEAKLMSAISSVDDIPATTSIFDIPVTTSEFDVPASTPVKKSRKTRETAAAPAKRQKVARSKTAEKPTYELAAPISVLTADSDIPLRDMLAFANRSVAVRHAEAEKKSGKIPRPSNSFVCYRSAYADRVMQWGSKNCHQNVSRITGSSWRIESEDVRRFYMNVAEIDRANHLLAFPGYKYNPQKKPSPESEDDDMFSPAPTPSKYNLRRR
jgi:hypothetical protein